MGILIKNNCLLFVESQNRDDCEGKITPQEEHKIRKEDVKEEMQVVYDGRMVSREVILSFVWSR